MSATHAGSRRTATTDTVQPSERLIFALDVPTSEEALGLVGQLDGLVSFFKVGLELLMGGGLVELLSHLNGKRVFVDLKLPDDIPETIRRTVARSAALHVDFLTLSGSVMPATIAAALDGRGPSARPKLLYVPLLSSQEQTGPPSATSLERDTESGPLRRARAALAAGCDGLIASGGMIELFSQLRPKPLLVSPGVRPAGKPTDEHKRSATPAQAIRMGADYLVVGRPIRDAGGKEERRRMARAIVDEITDALRETEPS